MGWLKIGSGNLNNLSDVNRRTVPHQMDKHQRQKGNPNIVIVYFCFNK